MRLKLGTDGAGFFWDYSELVHRGLNIGYVFGCGDDQYYCMQGGYGFGFGRGYGNHEGNSSDYNKEYPLELIQYWL